MRPCSIIGALLAVLVFAAGCGGSSGGGSAGGTVEEISPAGDIPDNQAFVEYSAPSGGYAVKVPEGWARTTADGRVVTFTDKLNSISTKSNDGATKPSIASAKADEVPALKAAGKGFQLKKVSTVQRKAGEAILITYRAEAKADPITGKMRVDAVERYTFFRNGKQVVLTLSGPVGADNVDPWRIVSDSLRWIK